MSPFDQPPPLNNTPVQNLRNEFRRHCDFLGSTDAELQLSVAWSYAIETPQLIWKGQEEALLTLIVLRSILGLESYVSSIVWVRLGEEGRLTPELNKLARNPFSDGRGGSLPDRIFNRLPMLVAERFALAKADQQLWQHTVAFYKTVRNPLLHGKEYQAKGLDHARLAMTLIQELYGWIDAWHPYRPITHVTINLGAVQLTGADPANEVPGGEVEKP